MNADPAERPLPLSQRLAQIVDEDCPDRLTFSDLAAKLHYRAWGALLFIFAAINVLPLPPGTTTFFAIPVLLVSAQMVFGRETPWFPSRIERRGMTKTELRRVIAKVSWFEARVERLFKPRMPKLTGRIAARAIGLACFFLGLVVAIPLPLLHHAPAASIALFGLALVYRDGVLVIVAAIASVMSIVIDALVIGSGALAVTYLVTHAGFFHGK
jgi:hypothetical protein